MTVIVTTEDKLREAKRELQMRIDVYPRWIERGQISAGTAELRIRIMESIVIDYQNLVEQEQLQGKLF